LPKPNQPREGERGRRIFVAPLDELDLEAFAGVPVEA
jgi:hypothetical protein